ncbi:MAG: hypothetical protein ABEI58_04110 [Candidatus Nanohaloarchaea archaeon]
MARDRKGDIDFVTLAVAMVPMVLFLVLSGQILVEHSVRTDLQAQMEFQDTNLESIVALGQTLGYNDLQGQMQEYVAFPEDESQMQSNIESNLTEALGYIEARDRQYKFVFDTPRGDSIEVQTSSTGRTYVDTGAYIASPKTGPASVKLTISSE